MSLQREKKHSVCFWKKGSEPIIQKMILAVLTFLLIITVATSVFKDVYAYEPEYAQEDTLFIKTEEPQVNVIPNANTNSSLESAKYIKQKKKSKKKHKERRSILDNCILSLLRLFRGVRKDNFYWQDTKAGKNNSG